MALLLDLVKHIVNVHWGGEREGFLYSGADGMFGSKDGEEWEKAPSSVPATSLAHVDGIWIGVNGATIWRSEDGAETWTVANGPTLREVVAFRPAGKASDNKPKPGVFVGWVDSGDDDGEVPNEKIYSSTDGGKTWTLALSIPTVIGDDGGYEFVGTISGCGEKAFIGTIRGETRWHHGDGMIYTSLDGSGFAGAVQFGPGDVTLPDETTKFPRRGYSAAGVGFDKKTKNYVAVGHESNNPSEGVSTSKAIYGVVSGEGGAGVGIETKTYPEVVGESVSTAGGNGMFVTGIWTATYHSGSSVRPAPGRFRAQFLTGGGGSSELFSLTDIFDDNNMSYQVGPFVFQSPAGAEENTDGEESTDAPGGTFACVAFRNGRAAAGGVWIAKDGDTTFRQKHVGTAIDSDPFGRRGGLGLGTINWLNGTA